MLIRENHHLIYSSGPYYLFKLYYVIKDFLSSHCAITTFSLIVGYCNILVINAQGAAICIWSTNSFTEDSSLRAIHNFMTPSQGCIGAIYDLDRIVC